MAFRARLAPPPGSIWGQATLIQDGADLITKTGTQWLSQSFPSEHAAKKHLLVSIEKLQKSGYVVVSAEEVDASKVKRPKSKTKSSSGGISIKRSRKRLSATFESKPSSSRLKQLFDNIRSAAPVTLHLECTGASPGRAWENAVKRERLDSIRHLIFDAPSVTQTRQGRNSLGNLSVTLEAMPSLSKIFATGRSTLAACTHSALSSVTLLGNPLSATLLDGLAGSTLPTLASLNLSLTSDAQAPAQKAVENAVTALAAPQLDSLCITGLSDVTSMLHTIGRASLTALRVLELSGMIPDEDELLAVVKESREQLAHLERVALPVEEHMSVDGCAAVRKMLPTLAPATVAFLPDTYVNW